jgi:hypothetical protein
MNFQIVSKYDLLKSNIYLVKYFAEENLKDFTQKGIKK